jgi:hypothetical protein
MIAVVPRRLRPGVGLLITAAQSIACWLAMLALIYGGLHLLLLDHP